MEENRNENEVREARDERFPELVRKQLKKVRIWRMTAFVFMLAFLAVLLVLILRKPEQKDGKPTKEAPDSRYVEKNLSKRVKEYNEEKHDAVASVEQVLGQEYLCLTFGENEAACKLYYRNEYSKNAEEVITLDSFCLKAGKMVELFAPASLDSEWDEWVPAVREFGGEEYLVSLIYANSTAVESIAEKKELEEVSPNVTMPDNVQLIPLSGPGMPYTVDLNMVLQNVFDYGFAVADNTAVAVLKYKDYTYTFTGSDEVLRLAADMENAALSFREHLAMSYTEDGISFASLVCAKPGEYYGEFSGDIIIDENGAHVSGDRFGVYIGADYEDPDGDKIITPRDSFLESKMTISHTNGRYLLPRYEKVERVPYDWSHLDTEKDFWTYTDESGELASEVGIDVSKHQGEIDWAQVADAGIRFAYIRLGFRGCMEGTLELDEYALQNLEQAKENGIKVGVYFYSQAITVEEGVEEANFVLEVLDGMELDYEIVWDTEHYNKEGARGNQTSRALRTQIGKAFCETVKAAGYKPMVYSNTYWSILNIDRDELADYPFWFAYYGDSISYTYDFEVLQYSESGKVPGVTGNCDLDIRFMR